VDGGQADFLKVVQRILEPNGLTNILKKSSGYQNLLFLKSGNEEYPLYLEATLRIFDDFRLIKIYAKIIPKRAM